MTDIALLDHRSVVSLAERFARHPSDGLPAKVSSSQVTAAYEAEKAVQCADPAAICEYMALFAERRGLKPPSEMAMQMDCAVMTTWPAEMFAKAARLAWERFAELRVPSPADLRGYIADDLAERDRRLAALHTLQLKLTSRERGMTRPDVPADRFGGMQRAEFI
jgi:hypothetical protein